MLLTLLLLPILLAFIVPYLHRRYPDCLGYLLALLPASFAVYLILQAPAVLGGQVLNFEFTLAASLGFEGRLRLDALGLMMAVLITGIGALILLYTQQYLKGNQNLGRLYICLLLFMAAMLGVVTAGNTLLLFLFWEWTSITSFLLIGFKHEGEGNRSAAWQALLVTAGGGLALFAGLLLMVFAQAQRDGSVRFGIGASGSTSGPRSRVKPGSGAYGF